MTNSGLDNLIQSLPLVEGEIPEVDKLVASYIEESLRDANPELYERIRGTIGTVYDELVGSGRLNTDRNGRVDLAEEQLRGVVAMAVIRGAVEVIMDLAKPLQASQELDSQLFAS